MPLPLTASASERPCRSPCINACTLDASGLCRGCLRTLAEISAWSGASNDERGQILAAVAARRASKP